MQTEDRDDELEQRDERESKTYRVIRGCFKGVLYGASALVWILIFITLFTTRQSKLMENMYFTEATQTVAKQTENYRVYSLYMRDFLNQGGSIRIANLWYAPETGELEFAVQYNKKLTDGNTDDPIRYVLTDSNGKEYEQVAIRQDAIGRYGYARVCFTGLQLPLEEDRDGDSLSLHLELLRKDDGKPLDTYVDQEHYLVNNASFTIFNNETIVQKTDFKG